MNVDTFSSLGNLASMVGRRFHPQLKSERGESDFISWDPEVPITARFKPSPAMMMRWDDGGLRKSVKPVRRTPLAGRILAIS